MIWLTIINALGIAACYFIDPHNLRLLYACNIIASFAAGPTPAIVWSMYADTADYGEWKTGRRASGTVTSAVVFALWAGIALGVLELKRSTVSVAEGIQKSSAFDATNALDFVMELAKEESCRPETAPDHARQVRDAVLRRRLVTTGIEISCPPILSISARRMVSIFCMERLARCR